MMRKTLFVLFLFISFHAFSAPINTANYKSFVGRKITFVKNIQKDQRYRISNKIFSTSKYSGKILTISNIKLDKKGNLVLFLTQHTEKKKDKTIKIKTKSQEIILENVFVVHPVKKTAQPGPIKPINNKSIALAPDTSARLYYSHGGNLMGQVFLFLCFGGIILVIYLFVKQKAENYRYIEEVTDLERGENSELQLILSLRRNGIEAEKIFHDLYVPTKRRTFSQIDLVLLSSVGIIVFEVKDYSGWLFGNSYQNKWTQVLSYGKEKHQFYNPIMQNAQHIAELKKYLKRDIPFFSVVVFYGDCVLKDISFVPPNTFVTKASSVCAVLNTIYANNSIVKYDNEILRLLTQAVDYGAVSSIRAKHIQNIHEMLGNDRIFH